MKEIRIEKITLNIGTGEAGAKVDRAVKLLTQLTGQKPIMTKAKKRIPTWGLRPGLTIGAKVTIRKGKEEFLKRMFEAVGNKIDPKKISAGTFSFGIPEYIQIPNARYDIEIGMIGLSVSVTLTRPGYRIKDRRLRKSKISPAHLISKEETEEFLKSKFNTKFGVEQR